ncbi:hypothetical protein OWV82_013731 [Melia azedarach]|uniref:Uncharacterized protein n=1 Tax=Melia azedarach TaxID=155640 RepID=A0ACC1XXC3_MELAZ|nr:hypothetical protein OWV82_013731 [Melia azedarach]
MGTRHAPEDATYAKWNEEDSMIMSWLWNSMIPACGEDVAILQKFLERGRIFEFLAGLNIDFDQIRVQILGKEVLLSLEGVFSIIWAEESRQGVMIDNPINEGSAMNSTKDGHNIDTNRNERGKGGNRGGQFRGQAHMTNAENIPGEKPNQDGLETLKEEIEKLKSMLNSVGKPGSLCSMAQSESSAFAARGHFHGANPDNRQNKGHLWCDHCRKPGHYKETCWKIHGKPLNWKPKSWGDRESHGNVAATTSPTAEGKNDTSESAPFTKAQLEVLQKLLSQSSNSTQPTTQGTRMLAMRGLGFGEEDWQC